MLSFIQLKPVKGDEPALGAEFEIEFSKVRGERPNPDKLAVKLISGQHGGLEWSTGKSEPLSPMNKMLIAIHDHKPKDQKELAGIMDVTAARVSILVGKAKANGYIEGKGLELTKLGKEIAEKGSF